MKRDYINVTWYNMMQRCYNETQKYYARYGGRGIKVCDEWHIFENFKFWALNNGYKRELTLDRIDNNGNYDPDNCRFVDRVVQANNRKNNRIETYKGVTDTIANLCRMFDKEYKLVNGRIQKGFTIEEAMDLEVNSLFTPNNKHHLITYKNQTKTLSEWSKILGMKKNNLFERLKAWNYDIDKCFNTPTRKRKTK